jgi:glutaredoxin
MLKVYSKDNCTYCVQAKKLLESKNIAYEEVRVDLDPNAREFVMSRGHRTVPQIYLDDQLFVEGGFQGLVKLSDQQLKEKLNVSIKE